MLPTQEEIEFYNIEKLKQGEYIKELKERIRLNPELIKWVSFTDYLRHVGK